MAEYLIVMHPKWCFLQLAAEKKMPLFVHPKQKFGPYYFISALVTIVFLL